jgi:hypothetical protein
MLTFVGRRYTAVLVVFISTNMASAWGTVPPPAEIAVTVTVLGTGTNSSSVNLTATTMLPSADQASGPSLYSASSRTGLIIASSFAVFTILTAVMVWYWKVYHSHKREKVYVSKPNQP